MRKSLKLRTVFIIYTIILYSFWSLLELYLKPKLGLDEFTKEVYLKGLIWLIPAVLIYLKFKDQMFNKKMYLLNQKCWIVLPVMLLLGGYIVISEYLSRDSLVMSQSLGISTIIEVLSIAVSEEMVFRGIFLNATLGNMKKALAVLINALMFLVIHFPMWIQSGTFISIFTSGGFITVLLLSCLFSFTFIKTRSIWSAIFLHFGWDLLFFLF